MRLPWRLPWLFQQYVFIANRSVGIANRTSRIADYLATYRTDRTDPYRRKKPKPWPLQQSALQPSSPSRPQTSSPPTFQPSSFRPSRSSSRSPPSSTLQPSSPPLQPSSPPALHQLSSPPAPPDLQPEGNCLHHVFLAPKPW